MPPPLTSNPAAVNTASKRSAKPLPPAAAARLVAAENGRAGARSYRAKPHSAEAIRAMVRAQMKQESEESRQRTLAKLAIEEQLAQEQQQARHAVRSEARRVYQSELMAQEQLAPVLPQPEAAPTPEAAAEQPTESSAARVEALLRERAERRQADAEEVNALRERVAAHRRHDRGQWAVPNAPPAVTHSENRSLFTWKPPPPTTERADAPAQPAAATRSEAAHDAWSWVQRADATYHVAPPAPIDDR